MFFGNFNNNNFLIYAILVVIFLTAGCGHINQQDKEDEIRATARERLQTMGIKYSENDFIEQVKKGNKWVVETFIEAGMDVDAPRSKEGKTALMLAAENGDLHIMRLLIEGEADLNLKADDEMGRTALIEAARRGDIIVVKKLIEAGAKIDLESEKWGATALAWALEEGHIDTAKFLIEAGADVNKKNPAGERPLEIARDSNFFSLIDFLKKHGARE